MTDTTDGVSVEFTVTFDFERFYTEAELAAAAPGLLDSIRRASTIEGSIDIDGEDAPRVRIVDELVPWVQNLCFEAVATLSTGSAAHVPYFARQGQIDLTPDGDDTEVTGDRVADARHTTAALCTALVDCGSRFLTFARTVKADDATYLAAVDRAAQYEIIAQAGLENWATY